MKEKIVVIDKNSKVETILKEIMALPPLETSGYLQVDPRESLICLQGECSILNNPEDQHGHQYKYIGTKSLVDCIFVLIENESNEYFSIHIDRRINENFFEGVSEFKKDSKCLKVILIGGVQSIVPNLMPSDSPMESVSGQVLKNIIFQLIGLAKQYTVKVIGQSLMEHNLEGPVLKKIDDSMSEEKIKELIDKKKVKIYEAFCAQVPMLFFYLYGQTFNSNFVDIRFPNPDILTKSKKYHEDLEDKRFLFAQLLPMVNFQQFLSIANLIKELPELSKDRNKSKAHNPMGAADLKRHPQGSLQNNQILNENRSNLDSNGPSEGKDSSKLKRKSSAQASVVPNQPHPNPITNFYRYVSNMMCFEGAQFLEYHALGVQMKNKFQNFVIKLGTTKIEIFNIPLHTKVYNQELREIHTEVHFISKKYFVFFRGQCYQPIPKMGEKAEKNYKEAKKLIDQSKNYKLTFIANDWTRYYQNLDCLRKSAVYLYLYSSSKKWKDFHIKTLSGYLTELFFETLKLALKDNVSKTISEYATEEREPSLKDFHTEALFSYSTAFFGQLKLGFKDNVSLLISEYATQSP